MYFKFTQKLVIIGFGSIAQSVLPLIFRHIQIEPQQITIITVNNQGLNVAQEYGINFQLETLTAQNYQAVLSPLLSQGDFVLNLSVSVSSLDLIKLCRQQGALYLDTCIEPWEGGYTDAELDPSLRSNYALRERVMEIKHHNSGGPTAVITHGANPGLVSYFLKAALLNIAKDNGEVVSEPLSQSGWAKLSEQLHIKAIHIAEYDSQTSTIPKSSDEFVNTWSVDGFISEGLQPAELGWGTHERHWPADGHQHTFGSKSAIYLSCPGAAVRVRTWAPISGSFHGFLITHGETISIADYYTIQENGKVHYRPTVHYAYHPCQDAVLSINELAGHEWQPQKSKRLLMQEITDGADELGVLLMGNTKGAYWYGSILSITEARKLAPHNNATSLQVSASVLAGMLWALEHPDEGLVEPEDIDHTFILNIARPYLGEVAGYYTDWTPINDREKLFSEKLDRTDPWQFINIRV
ncbi:MAG: homospermidine synthase [Gammaproteobacteria bacterium]|nr:homospermidine synthase [Gammaproteobacteria bacterium]